MAVPIGAGPTPIGTPTRLFEVQLTSSVIGANSFRYAPSADGQRFLVSAYVTNVRPSIDLLLNWPASLKK
jgi:hypothetical protein